MDNIKLLESLHTKILYSKLAEKITEQEIVALVNCKEQMKEIYNQALEDAEKRYREWSKSEYGREVDDEVLPIRVLRSLMKQNF